MDIRSNELINKRLVITIDVFILRSLCKAYASMHALQNENMCVDLSDTFVT
jgi:hypothetical protein